ncbi:hypothetical protein C0992_005743 [Termitomyces sp. T32_za158]|nr:hypothetical protein C0992_005743 [Termitomyces sp. T32_za158]
MPSYSPESWDGSPPAQSIQTNGRHLTPMPVDGQHGDGNYGASRTVLDASKEKLVAEHADNQDELIVNCVEGSQISSVSSTTTGYQNVRLVSRSTNALMTPDHGGVEVSLGLDAPMRDTFDERVGDPHQTLESLKHDDMINVNQSEYDVSRQLLINPTIESGMDVAIPTDFDDITRIFDDIDATNVDDRLQKFAQAPEEYLPSTYETDLSWTRTADSPASSFDIPTDIFHTPPRSASESHDSLRASAPLPSAAPVRDRVVMSHIAVPPFPRGTNSKKYRPILRHKKFRPIRPDVQPRMSMSEALQAAMNNNGAIRTVSSHKRIMSKSRAESVVSSRLPTGVVKNRKKAGGDRERERERKWETGTEIVSYHMDVSEKRVVDVAPSVSSFASTRRPSYGLQRREFGYTTYDSDLDLVHLTICGIPHDPPDIVSANTRFLHRAKRVSPTAKPQWGSYSTKADTDEYRYTQKWSSSCESLEGIDEALSTGEFWLVMDNRSVEEWEEEEEEVVLQEDDDEIMFIGRSGPFQTQPQPRTEKATKDAGVSNCTIRVGTSSVDDDEVEIIEVSFSPKQSKSKVKPKARPRTDSSVSSLGQAWSHDGAYGSLAKPGERGRAMLPPEAPHPPRLRTISQENVRRSQHAQKLLHAEDDEEERWPSAKALGKRRAVSPGRDVREVQRVQPSLSPSLSNSHSESIKKIKAAKTQKSPSKPLELLAMANMISGTMKSHPPPPQFFPDDFPSHTPLSSPNHSPSTPHLNDMTAQTLYADHSVTQSAIQPNAMFGSTGIMDSSSNFLESHIPASPFSTDAIVVGGDGPFLAGRSYLPSPTDDFRCLPPENQVEHGGGSLTWSPRNGTIDPSLLGGHPPEEHDFAPSSSLPVVSSAYLALVGYDSDTLSHSASSPPQSTLPSHKRRPASTPRRSSSPLTQSPLSHMISSSPEQQIVNLTSNRSRTSGHHVDGRPFASPSTSDRAARSLRVLKKPRLPDGKKAIADVHMEGDSDGEWSPAGGERPKKKIRVRRVARPPTYVADDFTSESEYEKGSPSRSKALSTQKRPGSVVAKSKQSQSLPPAVEWPRDPKRGEEYVSLRKSKANTSSLGTTFTRAIEKKRASDSIVPSVTRRRVPAPTIPGPVQYWATIYGIDGGRIGNAFVGNESESLVVPHFLGSTSLRQTRSRKRIFVGETQDSWGLGDECFVKDLNPVPWYERNNGPNERIYVGAKAPLSWLSSKRRKALFRRHEEPLSFDIRSPSPLSFLNDSEDGENVYESGIGQGELHQGHGLLADEMAVQEDIDGFVVKGPGIEFSPDSLGDTDVTRAISLGLIACGMTVQLSSC